MNIKNNRDTLSPPACNAGTKPSQATLHYTATLPLTAFTAASPSACKHALYRLQHTFYLLHKKVVRCQSYATKNRLYFKRARCNSKKHKYQLRLDGQSETPGHISQSLHA